MIKHRIQALIVVSAIFLVISCGGLPKEDRRNAETLPGKIEETIKKVAEFKENFEKSKQSPEYIEFIQPFDEREKWVENFTKANNRLSDAADIFEKQLKPILDKNDERELPLLTAQTKRIVAAMSEALNFAKAPNQRKLFLIKVRDEFPDWIKKAETENTQISSVFKNLSEVVTQAKMDYPQKAENLTGRLTPSKELYNTSQDAFQIAQKEYKLSKPDYAAFGDNCALITKNLTRLQEQDKQLRSKIVELGKSYSKILVDMRVDYYVQLGRTSWDERSDWPKEHEYQYQPKRVTGEVYEYFALLPENTTLAKYYAGRFGIGRNIDAGKWSMIQMPETSNWPSSRDNAAEYWIADVPVKYYHKYNLIEGIEQKETDWQEVNETYFEENEDNLGMALIVKSFGLFEEEVIKVATPPGLAMVGNPKYGRWEGEGNNRRWGWFESYLFYHWMFGGMNRHYYGYNDYNNWNRDSRGRSAYYGKTSTGEPMYGTSSTNTRQKYASSTYGRTGGFRRQASSVRGAAAGTRGGGPGARGK